MTSAIRTGSAQPDASPNGQTTQPLGFRFAIAESHVYCFNRNNILTEFSGPLQKTSCPTPKQIKNEQQATGPIRRYYCYGPNYFEIWCNL